MGRKGTAQGRWLRRAQAAASFAVGHISGGHFNLAVIVGLWQGKRFDQTDGASYIGAQKVLADGSEPATA